MQNAITAKLGTSAARLYAEASALVDLAAGAGAPAQASRLALARLGLRILCGDYHDFRASEPAPKHELAQALRRVPPHASISHGIAELARDVEAGLFDEDSAEAARYVARVAPPGRVRPMVEQPAPEPIELTPRLWRVFAWLYRYCEAYGKSPRLADIADGIGSTTIAVSGALRDLQRRGAVVSVGGARGWIPVRQP